MSQRAHGNKIHSGFGIGPHVFQRNPARALHRNPPFHFRAAGHCLLHLFDWHIVQQDCLRAMHKSFFQFRQRPDFNFNRLRTAPVAMGS